MPLSSPQRVRSDSRREVTGVTSGVVGGAKFETGTMLFGCEKEYKAKEAPL